MLGRIGLTAVLGLLGLGSSGPGVRLATARASRQAAMVLAANSDPGPYSGRTSQHESIAFTITSGEVHKLRFGVVISCSSHHSYRLKASGFAPIGIRSGRFHATVTSTSPAATATITGRVAMGRVTGTLGLRQYVAAEHGACAGAATYTATH